MLSDAAIKVTGLSKEYMIGARSEGYKTFREAASELILAPLRRTAGLLGGRGTAADLTESLWALQDLSFEVKRGEVVGIIGPNGAGKSTLLKILSRITEPTTGRVELHGRVASLLEVGTGFHPELTGRENILLNGSILGLSKEEILGKLQDIVDFAEIERFIDTPVKHYSSGMYVRLAFAVAAHLEPEILLIDEVLAVGDASFQRKCLGRMSDASQGGKTILFVSHNMTAVQNLCDRALLLEDGRVKTAGSTREVIDAYLHSDSELRAREWKAGERPRGPGVALHRIRVDSTEGSQTKRIQIDQELEIEIEIEIEEGVNMVDATLHFLTGDGQLAFETSTALCETFARDRLRAGIARLTCTVPARLLNDDLYRLNLLLVVDQCHVVLRLNDVVRFEAFDPGRHRGSWHGRISGAVRPRLDWTVGEAAPRLPKTHASGRHLALKTHTS